MDDDNGTAGAFGSYAATANVTPPLMQDMSNTEQAAHYLNRIAGPLIAQGLYVSVHHPSSWIDRKTNQPKKGVPGYAFTDLNTARDEALTLAQDHDAYLAMGGAIKTGNTHYNKTYALRKNYNVGACSNLYMDVDVKSANEDLEEKAYRSKTEMIAGLTQFIAISKLPPPNIMINSGRGGAHLYWVLDRLLKPAEWGGYAQALVNAAQSAGLKFDAGVTIDACRLLRIPGTFNFKDRRKDPNKPPLPVTLAYDDGKVHSVEALQQALLPFWNSTRSARTPRTLKTRNGEEPWQSKLLGEQPAETLNALGAGIPDECYDIDQVATACQFIADTLQSGGKGYNEPLWKLTINTAARCNNPEQTAIRLSNRHDDYDEAETLDKLAQAQFDQARNSRLGFILCETIGREGATQCAICPHRVLDRALLNVPGAYTPESSDPPENNDPSESVDPIDQLRTIAQNPSARNAFAPSTSTPVFVIPKASTLNLLEILPPREWEYGVFMQRKKVTLLAGPNGQGKTSFATAIGCEGASGRPLIGHKVHGGPQQVLFISNEEDELELKRRFMACARHYNLTQGDLDRASFIASDKWGGRTIELTTGTDNTPRLHEPGYALLTQTIEAHHPDTVIIDTLTPLVPVGLYAWGLMSAVVRRLGNVALETNVAMLLDHHVTKGADLTNQDAIGGSNQIVAQAKGGAHTLVQMTEKETEHFSGVQPSDCWRYFRIISVKVNNTPPARVGDWFMLHSYDLNNATPNATPPRPSDNVQVVTLMNKGQLLSKPQSSSGHIHTALRLIAEAEAAGAPLTLTKAGSSNPRSIYGRLEPKLYHGGKALDPKDAKQRAKIVIDELVERGWISDGGFHDKNSRWKPGATITPAGQKILGGETLNENGQ